MTGYIGIDFSLTGTGVAHYRNGEWDCTTIRSLKDDGTPTGFLRRVHKIAADIIAWADPIEGDVWAIESPAFNAKGAALDRMFGGWWIVIDDLTQHHAEPWLVPPTMLKKLATGKGNAGKDEVLAATVRRHPDAPIRDNNMADAVTLAVAASVFQGHPIINLPATHTAGIHKAMQGKP